MFMLFGVLSALQYSYPDIATVKTEKDDPVVAIKLGFAISVQRV